MKERSNHRKVLQTTVLQCQGDTAAMRADAEYTGLKTLLGDVIVVRHISFSSRCLRQSLGSLA
jgi:hypothetical protein